VLLSGGGGDAPLAPTHSTTASDAAVRGGVAPVVAVAPAHSGAGATLGLPTTYLCGGAISIEWCCLFVCFVFIRLKEVQTDEIATVVYSENKNQHS
jgi:hypothetical protein